MAHLIFVRHPHSYYKQEQPVLASTVHLRSTHGVLHNDAVKPAAAVLPFTCQEADFVRYIIPRKLFQPHLTKRKTAWCPWAEAFAVFIASASVHGRFFTRVGIVAQFFCGFGAASCQGIHMFAAQIPNGHNSMFSLLDSSRLPCAETPPDCTSLPSEMPDLLGRIRVTPTHQHPTSGLHVHDVSLNPVLRCMEMMRKRCTRTGRSNNCDKPRGL